ncbi:MAG: monovalent cation/H(+) antiporter subunit G [Chromatiaceae bacterium]|nr:monovalent cation/H(+) antiporter subunit G [Gammaproteobacteria bacterium]MCP5304537.1 monovalent cation/H(+) antiporter subunit G [Chromatiaceae bacterium]MCP5314265.1 monovalent cation/H(+) antiporter subunit G [Chromatiaceae bacterium]
MSTPLELLSSLCFLTGGILCLTGGVGLLRLPDFYARVHAAGLTETLATPLLLCGLMLQMDWSADLIKVFLILLLILATNPTATHAMAKAALHGDHKPLVIHDTDPAEEDRSSKG